MIQADPDCGPVFLTDPDEFCEILSRAFVVLVKITGIYSHLFNDRGYGDGRCGGEVDVGNKGSVNPQIAQPAPDFSDVRYVT